MKPEEFAASVRREIPNLQHAPGLLRDIGALIQARAKQNAPVRTGQLRDSITSLVEADSAFVGSDLDYAPFVEYGTRYMMARPFLSDAVEQSQEGIDRFLKAYGDAFLAKVANG